MCALHNSFITRKCARQPQSIACLACAAQTGPSIDAGAIAAACLTAPSASRRCSLSLSAPRTGGGVRNLLGHYTYPSRPFFGINLVKNRLTIRRLFRASLLAVLASACSAAWSIPVTFAFSGTVTSDPYGLSSFGASIDGRFTFESTALDGVSGGATGSYQSSGSAYGFSADVDGTSYDVLRTITINTANNIGVDQYGAYSESAGLTLEVFFEDATQSALSSDALPLSPPPLSAFGFRQFRLFSPDAEFLGTIDTLACTSGCAVVSSVPELGSAELTAAGLLMLSILRWRPRWFTRRTSSSTRRFREPQTREALV